MAILVWVLSLAGIDIPGEVAAAITTVLVAASAYLTPHSHRADLARPAGDTQPSA
ncbi:hypothetical protein OG417_38865 [Actinoallomurus sp. NBC_01490]|uniref:hypothetical protein n=1 Tax=Actinoallomurus sp. NBC_01490 TaxID=2903557 RepID=UPI002E380A59|nr:hypothetical protein [Actinoallomurus sp. NBC_01490]